MNKPLRAVIATIRQRIGIQDQQKLHDEVIRMYVHDTITDYDNFRHNKKERDDRFAFETPCAVAADEENKDFIVYFGEGTDDEIREFDPIELHYFDKTNPNDQGRSITLSTLGDFAIDSCEKFGRVGAFYGNNYDRYRLGMRLKLNMTPDESLKYDWRLIFERPGLNDVLSYDEPIPFPPQHVGLIEVATCIKCLTSVDDNSPTWMGRMAMLNKSLEGELATKTLLYKGYLESKPKARLKLMNQYNYKAVTRNGLVGRRRGYVPVLGED